MALSRSACGAFAGPELDLPQPGRESLLNGPRPPSWENRDPPTVIFDRKSWVFFKFQGVVLKIPHFSRLSTRSLLLTFATLPHAKVRLPPPSPSHVQRVAKALTVATLIEAGTMRYGDYDQRSWQHVNHSYFERYFPAIFKHTHFLMIPSSQPITPSPSSQGDTPPANTCLPLNHMIYFPS